MGRTERRLPTVARLAWLAWRSLSRRSDRTRQAELEAFLLDRVVQRPLLFEDGRGLRYVLRPHENAAAYLANDGNYEVAETRFCERLLRPGATAFDVGANIGLYSLLFSDLVGPRGHVHAFEPEPDNYARLELHLALNGAANVRARQLAVYSEPGQVSLNVFPPGLGPWHSLGWPRLPDPFRAGAIAEPAGTIPVEGTSLDAYASEHAIERIDLLKVDVEGAELDVLQGAQALLASGRIGALLFEVSLPQVEAMGHEPNAVFEHLAGFGYRSYRLDADGRPADEVKDAEARYENYVATRDPFADAA
jgi:FkbM family methyltransferase